MDVEHSNFNIEDCLIDLNKFDFVKKVARSENSEYILVKDKINSNQYIVKIISQFNSEDKIKDEKSQDELLKDLIFTLSQLDHSTIINFHGFSYKDFNGDDHISLVSEYAENGSLSTFISNCRKSLSPLEYNNTWCQIILLGIIRSMMLLHKYRKYNGNLKPSNILLDKNFHPKLTDFYSIGHSMSIYSAPEVLIEQFYSEKSDVYSFGIIMYELITLLEPFSEFSNLTVLGLYSKIEEGYRPQFKVPINPKMKELIERCWSAQIEERPSFEELFYKLAYDKEVSLEGTIFENLMAYVETIKFDLIFCTICHKKIDKDELVYYSGSSYHKKCVECSVCHKTLEKNSTENDDDDGENGENNGEFICVAPDLFLCKEHFDEIEDPKIVSKEKHEEYQDKMIKKIIDESFDSNDFNNNDQILDFRPDEIFIDSEMIQNSFQIDEEYEYIIPTITIHYGANSNEIDFNKLQELLGKDLIIINAKKGSLILKIAFIASNASQELSENHQKIISSIKNNLESSLINKPICSNLFKAKYSIPDKKKVTNFFKKKSFNHLQNFEFLDQIKIEEIKKEVLIKLKGEKHKKNWEFILKQQDLFDQIEKKIRDDIKNNKIEMIIIGQTVIVNKYFEEYEQIKNYLQEDYCESILYHGSRLSNHYGIISEHFREPNSDELNQHDKGFYGKGIYATNNLYYSTYYAHNNTKMAKNCKYLKSNEKVSIICCKAIYNKKYIKEINKRITGQEIDSLTYNEYGIYHVFVGDSNDFKSPIKEEKCKNYEIVGAEEFVFPNKFQIIPVCSFKIKRAEYLVLWKDENIYNEENSKYWNILKKHIEANVYITSNNEEAIDIIKLKRFNRIKFITNGGDNLSGKLLIEKIRKIIKSKFICLVFAKDKKHLDWIVEMENVIFTNRPPIFNEFVELNMKENLILDFISSREKEYNVKFKINKKELFYFPNYFNK